MEKLNMDLFEDSNLQVESNQEAGAIVVPCISKICSTGIGGGTTTCTTYVNCNPADLSLDFGF